jgi:hypothetical protein
MFIAGELQRLRRTGVELDAEAIEQAIAEGREKYAQHLNEEELRRPGRIPASIVYYIRRGALVKIGTTTRPQHRFLSLMPDEILAWEPGGRPEEAQRHQQFADLRVSSSAEFFRRGVLLDTHIAQLLESYGGPHPEWPSIGGLIKRSKRMRLPAVPVIPILVTLEEGTRQLGIRLGTAHVWIHRRKLQHTVVGLDGTKLYLLSDLRSLSEKGKARSRPKGD